MGKRYNSEDRDNFAFKGRRSFNHKRPKKGNFKKSRKGNDPDLNNPYSFKDDDIIYEDYIMDDYYTGEEDDFEKFGNRHG